MSGPPTLAELRIAADPARWRDAGFELGADGTIAVGAVRVRLTGGGDGGGIVGWSLRGAGDADVDGLATTAAHAEPPAPGSHPNGAIAIDHVVVFTPDLDRTIAALEHEGLELRRVREVPGGEMRQAFLRLGDPVLEVVGPVGEDAAAPAHFWGLVFVVEDLEVTAAALGERLGTARDAVQPGRRIATVRDSARLGVPLAFMTPHPRRG